MVAEKTETPTEIALILNEIKLTMNILKLDSKNCTSIQKETTKTLLEMQKCFSSIKIKMERISVEQSGYIESRKDRTANCDKVHADFESRLRKNPQMTKCETNELRLNKIEIKQENIQGFMYKIVGAITIIAIIIPPIVSTIIAFILKKFF